MTLAPGPAFFFFPARGLRTKTDFFGFPGRRTQTPPAPGPAFLFWRLRGLRTKTDFFGFAGRRTQTAPATGPPFFFFPARGLRTKTDLIDFAGRRTQTPPATGRSLCSPLPATPYALVSGSKKPCSGSESLQGFLCYILISSMPASPHTHRRCTAYP